MTSEPPQPTEFFVDLTATDGELAVQATRPHGGRATESYTPAVRQDEAESAATKSAGTEISERSLTPTLLPTRALSIVATSDRMSTNQPIDKALSQATSAAASVQFTQVSIEVTASATATSIETDVQPALDRQPLTSTVKPTVSDPATAVALAELTGVFTSAAKSSATPEATATTASAMATYVRERMTATPPAKPTASIEAAVVIPYTDTPTARLTTAATQTSTTPGGGLSQPLATEIAIIETATTVVAATERMGDAASNASTREAGAQLALAPSSPTKVAETVTAAIETPNDRATDAEITTAIATGIPQQTSVADLSAVDVSELATQAAVEESTRALPATEPPDAVVTSTPLAESATPLPEVFARLIATPTAFGAADAAAEPDCTLAVGWLPYEVQSGDSLLALALASGSSLIELREGNCFSPVTGIIAGENIVVPNLPASPIMRADSLIPVSDVAKQVKGCNSTRAMIFEPGPMTELYGVFAIRGRVVIPDGGKYRLSVKPAWSPDYHRFLDVESSVNDDIIGLINTEIFGTGLQRLRLELVGNDGNIVAGSLCELPVVFMAHQTAMSAAIPHPSGRQMDG